MKPAPSLPQRPARDASRLRRGWAREVLIALQRLGVETIAVDHTQRPGHQVAHRAHVIPMTDGAALRALVEQEKPHLIVPRSRPSPPTCWCRSRPRAWPR